MVNVTTQQLTNLFEGTQTWEQMATSFAAEAGIKITPKMIQDMFKANGFNLKSRSRKSGKANWFTIIDDTSGAEEVTEIGEEVFPEFA